MKKLAIINLILCGNTGLLLIVLLITSKLGMITVSAFIIPSLKYIIGGWWALYAISVCCYIISD
jgi:hypothetical protein